MRTERVGSRFLRVVGPDKSVRYFAIGGIPSLRISWVFRNFSNLNERVLSERQLELFRRICTSGNGEIAKEAIDPQQILGTLELSRAIWKPDLAPQAAHHKLFSANRAHKKPQSREFVISANALSILLLFTVIVLVNKHSRGQLISSISKHSSLTAFLHRGIQSSSRSQDPARSIKGSEQKSDVSASESNGSPVGRLAASSARTFQVNARNVASSSSSSSFSKNAGNAHSPDPAELLQPAGPPQIHPVLDNFSEVSRDTRVVLRAVVAPDGQVRAVNVLEGQSSLAREAMQAVKRWRYAARATANDAESRIVFQFLAPDVVTVSFLDSAGRPSPPR